MPTTFTETPDPMYGSASYGMDVFFDKWGGNLDKNTVSKWDWTEMKKRLAAKPSTEKWFIVKSVDTLPAEDDSVPFVPNFICFVATGDGTQQAPRFCMKAATRSETHDPEAFISDDIVDMSTSHEWRPLKDHKDTFVLCARNEKTDTLITGFTSTSGFEKRANDNDESGDLKRSKTDEVATGGITFGGIAPDAAPATGGITFGGQAPDAAPAITFGGQAPDAAPAITFGGQAPDAAPAITFGGQTPDAAPAITFGGQAPDAAPATDINFGGPAPPAGGGFSFGGPPAAAPSGGSDFFSNTSALDDVLKHEVSDEPVFPVFWQENTISDLREEIRSGAKIITQFVDPETNEKMKVVIENDLEFLKASVNKQTNIVTALIQKHALKKSAAFSVLLDKYQGDGVVSIPSPEELERMAKEFKEKKQELIDGDLADEIDASLSRCLKPIIKLAKNITNERRAKNSSVLDNLTTINRDIKKGEMFSRSDVTIQRVFPEKNSMGEQTAFRPSKQINKSAGRADVCYPDEYILVNTLLLVGKK